MRSSKIAPKNIANLLASAAYDKKANDIIILNMKKLCSFADYFVICSADSDRGVKTIVENIEKICKDKGIKLLGIEGLQESKWVLVDTGDVIVHVFYEPSRAEYDIESLWSDAPRVNPPFIQEEAARP